MEVKNITYIATIATIATSAIASYSAISSSVKAEQINTSIDTANNLTASILSAEIFEAPELIYLKGSKINRSTVSASDISIGKSTDISIDKSAVDLAGHFNIQDDTDWKGVSMNADERKVIEALANPEWDFRTVAGIARETGLNLSYVKETLGKFPQLIRHCDVPDKDGRLLYTLSNRPKKFRERLALFRVFLTKSLG